MTDLRKAAEMALEALIRAHPISNSDKHLDAHSEAMTALHQALNETPPCKTDPQAPHGFDRNASHSADRYVCECEGWEPPEQEPVAYVTDSGKSAYILLGVDLEDDTPLYTAPPSIEAAVLAEREACAKVCEKERDDLLWREGQTLPQGEPRLIHMAGIAGHCADIIRARSEK